MVDLAILLVWRGEVLVKGWGVVVQPTWKINNDLTSLAELWVRSWAAKYVIFNTKNGQNSLYFTTVAL